MTSFYGGFLGFQFPYFNFFFSFLSLPLLSVTFCVNSRFCGCYIIVNTVRRECIDHAVSSRKSVYVIGMYMSYKKV